jgi:hypothetical protein
LSVSHSTGDVGSGWCYRSDAHGTQHDVLHGFTVISTVTFAGSAKCLAIATVQSERDPQFFTVITAELEAVRAPPLVTFSNYHFPVCARFDGGIPVYVLPAAHSDA